MQELRTVEAQTLLGKSPNRDNLPGRSAEGGGSTSRQSFSANFNERECHLCLTSESNLRSANGVAHF